MPRDERAKRRNGEKNEASEREEGRGIESDKDREKTWEPTDEKTRVPGRHAPPRKGRQTGQTGQPRRGSERLARGEEGHGDAEDLEPDEPRLDKELGRREDRDERS